MSFFEALEQPWQAAFAEAWEAFRAGSLPIGAVITLEGKIIAQGRNRLGERHQIAKFLAGTNIAHAEINALVQIPMHLENQELHLYTTLEPCPMCAGAIRMSHIQHLHFAAHDRAGMSRLLESDPYMSREWLHLHKPSNQLLEDISVILCFYAYLEEYPVPDKYYQYHQTRFPRVYNWAMQPKNQQFLLHAKRNLEVQEVLDGIAGTFSARA